MCSLCVYSVGTCVSCGCSVVQINSVTTV
jgi:hypothetical protein